MTDFKMVKCKKCNQDFEIEKFSPLSKGGNFLFDKNIYFFVYARCRCGEYIIDKEIIDERKKEEKLNQEEIK